MRLGDLDDLKKDIEENAIELGGVLAIEVDCAKALIDNAQPVEIPCNQIIWEQGYECGKNERPQGEWIPVSERLPDKNMPCLVSGGKLNLTQIAMYSDLMETIDHKIFYIGDYGKDDFRNITEFVNAWQPLPEPYKKGGKE